MTIKGQIKRILPRTVASYVRYNILDGYARRTYAQEGEDVVLMRIFESKSTGYYVDVGAHHPQRFSNTYYFYKLGWRGLNIDAMPGSMKVFKRTRPRDINLEYAVSDNNNQKKYYMFEDSALNTLCEELAQGYIGNGRKVINIIDIPTRTLSSILDEYLFGHSEIEFMSVDVEGLDVEVLKSNDWNKYRPLVVLVECLEFNILNPEQNELVNFLDERGYNLFAKTVNTVFFRRND